MMHDYLNLEGIYVSKPTVYRYMKELGIEAIINKKKPLYIKGKAHKIFGNIINRNFNVGHTPFFSRNRIIEKIKP